MSVLHRATEALRINDDVNASRRPVYLKDVRLKRFQATFAVRRE